MRYYLFFLGLILWLPFSSCMDGQWHEELADSSEEYGVPCSFEVFLKGLWECLAQPVWNCEELCDEFGD